MASNFFVAFNFYALMAITTSFAISELSATETEAGFGAGVFVIGALTARLAVSRYSARLHFKKTLLIGIGALIVFTALLFSVNSFLGFCVVRFCGGLTFGVNNNMLITAVTYIIPENRKGEGLGWFSLSQILGMALGPFFAVSIMHSYGFRDVFLIVTLAAAVSFIVIIFAKLPEGVDQPVSAGISTQGTTLLVPRETGIWQFFERTAITPAILCFILYLCNNNYMSFAAIFVTESGAVNLSSVIFLVYAGAMLILRPIVGTVFDKHGPNQLLVYGFILYAAGFFLLGRGITAAFLPSALLLGFGISALQGTTLSIVVTNAPRHRIAVANATYFFSFDFGAAVGPVFGGKIIEHAGYGIMFTVCAVLVIICLPLYFGVLARGDAHKSEIRPE